MQLEGRLVKAEKKMFEKDGKNIDWFDALFLTKAGTVLKVNVDKTVRDEAVAKLGADTTVTVVLRSDEKFHPRLEVISFA